MKYFPFLLLLLATPAQSITWNEFWKPFNNGTYYHRPVYHYPQRICTKYVYRETYVPGDRWNPGYVRSWRERVQVPCNYY